MNTASTSTAASGSDQVDVGQDVVGHDTGPRAQYLHRVKRLSLFGGAFLILASVITIIGFIPVTSPIKYVLHGYQGFFGLFIMALDGEMLPAKTQHLALVQYAKTVV